MVIWWWGIGDRFKWADQWIILWRLVLQSLPCPYDGIYCIYSAIRQGRFSLSKISQNI